MTGHNTVTGGVGLPTITVGPHTPVTAPNPVPARNYAFGPNSISRSASNDFTTNVVDDSASYAGLLQPVTPATLGFFINQGYSRELLFFLFVDRMRLLKLDGSLIEEYENDPVGLLDFEVNTPDGGRIPSFQQINSECFQNYLAWMIREGFTAQIDVDALPAARTAPANRLCADTGLATWFQSNLKSHVCTGLLDETKRSGVFRVKPTPGRLRPICNGSTPWSVSKADGGSSSTASAAKDSGSKDSGSSGSATATSSGSQPLTVTVESKTGKDGKSSATATTSNTNPVTLAVTAPPPPAKQASRQAKP